MELRQRLKQFIGMAVRRAKSSKFAKLMLKGVLGHGRRRTGHRARDLTSVAQPDHHTRIFSAQALVCDELDLFTASLNGQAFGGVSEGAYASLALQQGRCHRVLQAELGFERLRSASLRK